MHFQRATSILAAGCAVAAVDAKNSAAILLSSPTTATQLLSSSDHKNGPRRLLQQKLKKRRQQASTFTRRKDNQYSGAVTESDVGILGKRFIPPRFLQDETEGSDYDYYCPADTCPAELCECATSGGSLEDCTTELQNVCRAGRLGDCVYEAYVKIYEDVYCPFVSCVDQGFREDQCDCAFYELYCSRLKSADCADLVHASQADAADADDEKPFFGCDEKSMATVCDTATYCKEKGDLQGLDLGAWQGSVVTMNSSERMRGSGLAGVSLLSVVWLLVMG